MTGCIVCGGLPAASDRRTGSYLHLTIAGQVSGPFCSHTCADAYQSLRLDIIGQAAWGYVEACIQHHSLARESGADARYQIESHRVDRPAGTCPTPEDSIRSWNGCGDCRYYDVAIVPVPAGQQAKHS